MLMLIRKLYCQGCRRNTKHIIVIQKIDLQGYTFQARAICLEMDCNDKRDLMLTYEEAKTLMLRDDDDDPLTKNKI